jgi:hypothetical protein
MSRSLFLSAASIASLLAYATVASAETDGERAIALGKEGLELYAAEKWSECAVKFATADALSQSPVFRLYGARCLRGGGKLLEARERFAAVVAEPVAQDAPGPWKQAQLDGKAELAQLEKAIPTVTVNLKGAAEGALLKLDGKEAKPGLAVALDPGLHKVSGSFNGETKEQTFELSSGAQEVIELDFTASQPSGPKVTPPTSEGSGPGVVPGIVVASIGGAAAIAGAIFGGLAVSRYDKLSTTCELSGEPAVCPADAEKLDTANLFADLGTGLLIGGGVTLVTGVILIFALPSEAEVSKALIPGGFRF